MQLLSPLSRDGKAVAREKPAGHHLPYARHVDDHTIETRDGLLMQVDPPARPAVRDRRHRRDQLPQAPARRDAAGDRLVALRPLSPYRPAPDRRRRSTPTIPTTSRSRLDAAWRARLATKQLYVNDLFLTLIRRPLQGRVGGFDRLRGCSAAARGEDGASARLRAAPARRRARRADRGARQLRAAAARRLRDAAGRHLLGAARIPLLALQWRDAPGAAADAGSRRLSALSPGQLRPGDGGARPGRPEPAQLPRHGLDQGLSGPDRARHARRIAAPAVRADRLAKLRLRRPPGGARRG